MSASDTRNDTSQPVGLFVERLGGDTTPVRHVRVVGADAVLGTWIGAVLADDGLDVRVSETSDTSAVPALLIADLPYPTRAEVEAIRARVATHGPVPILVLSPAVFASVDCCGSAAHAIGANGLLPKPIAGDVLRRAVHRLIGS